MVSEAIGGSRWKPTFRTCESWEPTQEGITDFVKRHRDLAYCKNEGSCDDCMSCAAHKNNGYGDSVKPSIKFTKGYACPL